MKLSFNPILNNITFSDKYPNEILNEINNFILGTKIELGAFGSNVNQIDYSGIIASLNLLTDTSDTFYDGTNPTLAGMETQLDTINGEIITV